MPPPVALGGKPSVTPEVVPAVPQEVPQSVERPSSFVNQKPMRPSTLPPANSKPQHLTPSQNSAAVITPITPAISPLTPSQPDEQDSGKLRVAHFALFY